MEASKQVSWVGNVRQTIGSSSEGYFVVVVVIIKPFLNTKNMLKKRKIKGLF